MSVVGLSAWHEIAEEYGVADHFDVESEEGPSAAYADAIYMVVAHELAAVGDLMDNICSFYSGDSFLKRL